jgi:hypothetical protein
MHFITVNQDNRRWNIAAFTQTIQNRTTIFGLTMGKAEYSRAVTRQQKPHPAVAQIAHTIEYDYHIISLSRIWVSV